jgi:hypothetical protein
MKKNILILIFLFNILPNIHNNQISLSIGNQAYAQIIECPNQGGGNGTTSSWWNTFTSWLSNAGTWIGQQWNNGGAPSNPNSSNGFPYYLSGGAYIPNYYPNDPNYNPNGGGWGGGPNSTLPFIGITADGYYMNGTQTPPAPNTNPPTIIFLPLSQCDPITNPFCISMIFPNQYDCAGAFMSYNNASLDVCGRCSGGATGIVPCNLISQTPADTLKATKINCDTVASDPNRNSRAAKSTQILDAIKDSAATKNARDSAPFRKFEVGFNITQAQPQPGNYTYRPENYNKAGGGRQVVITKNPYSIAGLHVHPKSDSAGHSGIQSQSPQDYYNILANWNNPYYANHRFDRAYVISGDSARNEFVVVIADTNLVKQFLLNHPFNTVINTNPNSPYKSNWLGDLSMEGTYLNDFYQAGVMFLKEGYPKSLLNTYANVYMLQAKGMGIKLQQKVNGQFKELNFLEKTDPTTGKRHYTITICQ